MNFLKNLLNDEPYSYDSFNKDELFKRNISRLTSYHYSKSEHYRNYLKGLKFNLNQKYDTHEIPFLPVRLFKEFDFFSIKKKDIFKTLYSSGTTSKNLSKIYLDKFNALNQIKVLQKIMNNIIGTSRLPMLVIDKHDQDIQRNNFNASRAAVNGFSMFANEIKYLLKADQKIDYKILNKFLKKNGKKKFLIFGFTAKVYENLIKKLDISKIKEKSFFFNAILIHGGGWKKIEEKKLTRSRFNSLLKKKLKINVIKNYYGLVEQIGSIFFECKCGYFVPSNFSDVIIRDENFNVCKNGQKGFVQLLSLLPSSYPGHNILTEDIGEIVDDNSCKCFKPGKRFLIYGRLKDAEVRGCSNI